MNPEFTKFACDAIQRAGNRTLLYFRNSLRVEAKEASGFDPVTLADRECELFLRREITRTWPSHGIIGEEYDDLTKGKYSWVIDPIDGTRAFISGLLHWGVLLALCEDGQPILGVMYQPFTGELFVGEPGGAWYEKDDKKQPLQTRRGVSIASATLMTTDPRLFRESAEAAAYQRLENSVRLARYGGDCYQYAMLALGTIDIVCETRLKIWDIHALIPLVRSAGGVITDWSGGDPASGGRILASGSERLHAEALKALAFDS